MKPKLSTLLLSITFAYVSLFAQDAEVLNETTQIEISAGGKLTQRYSISVQINNRRGEDLTRFHISHSKNNKIKDIEGNITSLNGEVLNKLSKKEIKKVSSDQDNLFYIDEYTEFFTLRHNVYPYIIHCSYTQEYTDYLEIIKWCPMYVPHYPTRDSKLIITVPTNFKINIKENNLHYIKDTSNSNTETYFWESSYTDIIKEEAFSPDIYEVLPSVYVVPENFNYGIPGSFKSWGSFGLWKSQLLTGLNDLPETEKYKILDITKNLTDPIDKLKTIYYYFQDNTRYINVTLGIGGYKPHPASYVCYNKYGDCKALSNYLKSLLEVVGIKSYYSTICAGQKIDRFYYDFPSQQFNHAILMVPFEKDTFWLECTNQNLPFGYLGIFTQNRPALVMDSENSRLISTPALDFKDVITQNNTMVDLNFAGKSKVNISVTGKGEFYESARNFSKENSIKDQDKYIHDNLNYSDFELNSWLIEPKDRDSASITLKINIESNDFYKLYGNEYVLNIIKTHFPKLENPKDRKLPLVFDYPTWDVNTLIFKLPPSVKISYMPSDTVISNRFGSYELHFTQSENILKVETIYKINRGHYEMKEYPQFFEFVKSIQAIERKSHPILTL